MNPLRPHGFLSMTFLFLFWLLHGWSTLEAEVIKELRLESDPPGAQVFLKQVGKETLLGKTPTTYQAEFHSEISILRMVFKKSGYQDALLEVSGKQEKVVAHLETRGLVASPTVHTDTQLQAIQQRLNPILNQTVPGLLEVEGPFDFDLASPIRVARMNEKVFIVVPITLRGSKVGLKESGKARQEALLKTLWNQCGGGVVVQLAQKVQGQVQVDGIVLDVTFDEQRYLFSVDARVETRIEMQCVAGTTMQSVYDSCASTRIEFTGHRDSLGNQSSRQVCVPGFVTKPVYNPCASRVPVTKSDVKVDPKAGVTRNQARARYIVPLALIGKETMPEQLYEQVGILLTDAKGGQLMSRGNLPTATP